MTKAFLLIFNEKAYLFRVGGEGSMEKNKRKRDPFY